MRALLATAFMVALFFAGAGPAKAAIIIGGLLLLTRRVKSERVYAEIDWSLLLMFAGLFIIVAGAQHALLTPGIIAAVGRLHLDQVPVLSAVTAVLSNLVSNVPAVSDAEAVYPAAAGTATPPGWSSPWPPRWPGNFTVLGSIANLIVMQRASARGVAISFWDYFRVGAPLTVHHAEIGTFGCGCDQERLRRDAFARSRSTPSISSSPTCGARLGLISTCSWSRSSTGARPKSVS